MEEHKCVGRVWSSHSFSSSVCGKKAKYHEPVDDHTTEKGWYCGTHAPSLRKARQGKRDMETALHREECARGDKIQKLEAELATVENFVRGVEQRADANGGNYQRAVEGQITVMRDRIAGLKAKG